MSDIPLEYVHREPEAESESAVFVLHGRGADEQDLLPVAEQLPGDHHVISFRAPDHLQGGYTWYQLDLSGGGLENSQPHPAEFRRSLDIVAESVDAAVATFNLDPDRLGLLGFSQGAITSFSSVLEAPDRFAWVVGLHGYLAEDHADAEPEGIKGNRFSSAPARATRSSPRPGARTRPNVYTISAQMCGSRRSTPATASGRANSKPSSSSSKSTPEPVRGRGSRSTGSSHFSPRGANPAASLWSCRYRRS